MFIIGQLLQQVKHDEVGHWEDVVVKEAWTESVPIYEEKEVLICNGCGADITSDPWGHIEDQALAGNMACGSFHGDYQQVQVGTNTINHPAVVEKKWIVDKAAWVETVTTGHTCSGCGAKKQLEYLYMLFKYREYRLGTLFFVT